MRSFAPTLGNRLFMLTSDADPRIRRPVDKALCSPRATATITSCPPLSQPSGNDCEVEVTTLVLLADDSENYRVAASQSDGSHFDYKCRHVRPCYTDLTRLAVLRWRTPTDARCDSQGGAEVRNLTGLTLKSLFSKLPNRRSTLYKSLGWSRQTNCADLPIHDPGRRFGHPGLSFSPPKRFRTERVDFILVELLLEPAQ